MFDHTHDTTTDDREAPTGAALDGAPGDLAEMGSTLTAEEALPPAENGLGPDGAAGAAEADGTAPEADAAEAEGTGPEPDAAEAEATAPEPDAAEAEASDAPGPAPESALVPAGAEPSGGETSGWMSPVEPADSEPDPSSFELLGAPAADEDMFESADGAPEEYGEPAEGVDIAESGPGGADEASDAAEEESEASGAAAESVPEVQPRPSTVARSVAAALHAAGVKFAFTVPGESFLPLLEALPETGIKVIATRHESGAAFMAEAYGQLTGRPAAVLATRAVGAANLAIGLHTARQNSTPMFVIVGQVVRRHRGREAFQEVDLVESFGRLAKWATEVDRATSLPAALEEAVRRAMSGRPGPVLISLPEDLLEESTSSLAAPVVRRMGAAAPDSASIRNVLRLLTDAERPIILAGGGVLRARATSDLVKLAEILEVPVVAAWRRADVFPNDHRLFLGTTGFGAPASVRARLVAADAILVIGCRLSEVASFGYAIPSPEQRWAHVDLEPRRAEAGLPEPRIAITADARSFLRAARERLAGAVHVAESLDSRRARNVADRADFDAASPVDATPWDGPGVHPGRVVATLARVLPSEAILTTDAGNFSGWLARGYRFRRPGTFLGPTSGAMGYGLPAAVSAALVHRDRPVVAVAGDGGFAMTMTELETAVRERARVVAIVFDNERYGMIRSHQDRRPDAPALATDLGPIDFAAAARALGANGVTVDDDAGFEPALIEALAADRATVIHLRLDRRWGAVADDLG